MFLMYIGISFILILVNCKPISSSSSQFCSVLHTTTKQDNCPDPSSFDILEEYAKPATSWKLNFSMLTKQNDADIIRELTQRFNQGTPCSYMRQTNKTTCCDGWQGPACDKPGQSFRQPSFVTCHLWGRDYIRTYDGTYYRFPASCAYKLTGSITWQINVEFTNCSTMKDSCQKKLTVVVAGKTLEILGTNLTNLTAYPSNLNIQRQDKNNLELHFTNGIRLKVHRQHQYTIMVQLDESFLNDPMLSGLCADYNNKRDDDFRLLVSGQLTTVPVEFGNQWKLNRNCPDVPPVVDNCLPTVDVVNTCISLTNQSEIFRSCLNEMNGEYFYNACIDDVCSAMAQNKSLQSARCQLLEAFVEECQEYNINVQWRSKTGCAKHCSSENMIFVECVSPCRRTCQNPSSKPTQCHSQNSECISGCVCTDDTVLDIYQNACVRLEQCTCQYNNIQYQPGDHVSIDCNDCECDHGRWICTNRTCSRMCVVLGNMNVLTFDGKQYGLTSKCNQILLETYDQSNNLRITYNNEVNELNVQIINTNIAFHQDNVVVNGKTRHILPFRTDDVLIRRASTVFVEVRNTASTVVLHFDSLTSRIYIHLHPSFSGRVRGLCGTFNYITNDDFLTPSNVIETNLVAFANAYVASSCTISGPQVDTCLNFPANERTARLECTNLLKHPIFSDCSSLMGEPTFFITSCIRDLCEDQSTTRRNKIKCSAIAALAHACASKGITIDWMNNETLASACQTISYGQCGLTSRADYSECVSECRSTCTDLNVVPPSCINHCLPGCTCKPGQFYDEYSHVCQVQYECSCFELQSEQYIYPSQSLSIQTPIVSNCSCSNGSLDCTSFEQHHCSSTQIYSLNATICPRTCTNYLSHYDCGLYSPGCTCPPGTVLLDSTATQQECIPIEQCPCQYNRQFYTENQTVVQSDHGCQNCTCQKGGIWSCEKISCIKSCITYGDSHYQTFDRLYYNFPGRCQYVLVKDMKNVFRILSQNIACGTNGQICSKNILIEYNGVTVDLVRGRPILLSNFELTNYDIQPVTFGRIHIYQLGIYTIIKTDDFTVKWNGQTYVDISVLSNNRMAGLCGNNNDNLDDDFQTTSGASYVDVFDMAQSWQTSVQCSTERNQTLDNDPCGDSPEHSRRRTWAQTKCDLIKVKSSVFNNPFEMCIEKMESHKIEKYYRACLYDACHADHGGDCESVCTVLSAFAAECQSLIKEPIIKWRTSSRCPMQCDSGKVYMACGPLCPQSCFTEHDYGGCIADSGCVEGCFCPNGQVTDDNGQCIEPAHCPCSYNNKIYPQNSRITMMTNDTCHQECECLNGTFVCDPTQTATCLVTNCTNNEFRCASDQQCIPLKWTCDHVVDCVDGSDESIEHCQHQCTDQLNTFQCSNGQCIDIIRRCDGLPDCRDGSDETNCSYVVPCKEYQCPISKICIPKAWICDGTVDCGHGDKSDESGDCKFNQCDTLSGRYFQCRDNFNCLPIEQRCDGHKDCDDGSDERNCSPCTCTSLFSCAHVCQCIDTRRVCDGISDCIDGTDEYNCTANCAKDEYTCLDGKCLNRKFLCDGIQHCTKGEDESHPDCTLPITAVSTSAHATATIIPTTPQYMCKIQSALVDDQLISKPEFSTPIVGSILDLNPGKKGVDFLVHTPSTSATIVLPLQPHVVIKQLVKFQLLRPSNIIRFQLTFLNRHRQPLGKYKFLSTESQNSLMSPTIDKFPIETNLLKHIRSLKIEILDTDNNQPPQRVTLEFQACFEQMKEIMPSTLDNCSQVDAMDSVYTTRIIAKIGGTRPVNSSYGNLLQTYGGVTYNTSQAVIDLRLHSHMLSRINEISIPDYALKRTNVKKIVVELFNKYHSRLFREESTNMKVTMNARKKLHVRFIRVSILETNDNYAPFNVTLSVKGCFFQKHMPKKTTTKPTTSTTVTTKSLCTLMNALDPQYAHKIIGQFEGTLPLSGLSFANFINSSDTGVSYRVQSPILRIRFQLNVVGQLHEISLISYRSNVKQFQVDLFDINNALILSKQTTDSEPNGLKSLLIPHEHRLLVSLVQITILNTIDNRPARNIVFSILGCFSTIPKLPTSTTTTTAMLTLTTKLPRDCNRIELMKNKNILVGLASKSRLTQGDLSEIGHIEQNGVTFSDLMPNIDIVFRTNRLIHLSSIAIISSKTNLQRFRIELLNSENDVQYTIESASMMVNLDYLPSVVLAGIRLTLLQTTDNEPPRNIVLSIQACVEEILTKKSTTTTTTTPPLTTRQMQPYTIPSTPDHCADIDAMQKPYSEQILAGLSGTNASLIDLIHGKALSFDEHKDKVVLFVIFKTDIFAYLKYVGLLSPSSSNVKRIHIEYLDKNQLLMRNISVDYSHEQTQMEPIEGVGSIKITIEETYDGKSARHVLLSVRGCFAIQPRSTITVQPTVATTKPTECHHLNLMSSQSLATKIVNFVAGTTPSSSSIYDYFNSSTSISYSTVKPTLILVFKTNIYVELKSISITNNETNVRDYKIDLIDNDRTILQTILFNQQNKSSNVNFYVPIGALQITYLTTTDEQPPQNIILNIDGCFGMRSSSTTTLTTSTRQPPTLTTSHCHEIDMMNKIDATVLVDSVAGTLPQTTVNKLTDYFNQTALISYDEQSSPIKFFILFKSTVHAEIHSISLISSTTNVRKFQVDLIGDDKSVVQTIVSDQELKVEGLTEIGIAAVQIIYLDTSDGQPPSNIRLSIKGCFGMLPIRRRTTQTVKHKCTILDVLSIKNRHNLIESINGEKRFSNMFSSNVFSFNATSATIDITFKHDLVGNIDSVSIVGNQHNIERYRVTFFDLTNQTIDERSLTTNHTQQFDIENVASLRIALLETIDQENISNVQLSIRGCFFKIPTFTTTQMTTTIITQSPVYCNSIELFDQHNIKRLLHRIDGTLMNSTLQGYNKALYFILEFNANIYIHQIQNITIRTPKHQIEQIRIELQDEHRQLLKRFDMSMVKEILTTNLYTPNHPLHAKYLKLTVLKGKVTANMKWSIMGCFDQIEKVKPMRKFSTLPSCWKVSCIHSNILAKQHNHHKQRLLTPHITGTPLPIGESFQELLSDNVGISYSEMREPIIIEIDLPSGIVGRLYEVGIRSSNVYRIRVELLELPNGLLYTLTSPQYNTTEKKNPNPRLTGFPPVISSGIRVILLNTTDGQAPRHINIFTNGCFYKSSVRYTVTAAPTQPKTTKSKCRYSEWTQWGHCSVSCGNGVEVRARNQLSGQACNGTLKEYRMCQLQPCSCVLTKEFYMTATGEKVPSDTNIVGYLKGSQKAVHIGDILDTNMVVYAHKCREFICSNFGLDMRNSTQCQQKCIYLSWSKWSACQGRCGEEHKKGIQFRQRLPLRILIGSHLCEPQKEYRSCKTPPCFGACLVSSWSRWSTCSKTCNLGVQQRSRHFLSFQPNCTNHLEEKRDCNPQCCPSKEKPTWSEWSPWSNCSQACDGGERTRYRTCKTLTSECQSEITCTGPNKQIEPCNTGQCLSQVTCMNGKITSNCSNACGHTCRTLACRSCNEPSVCVPGCICPEPLVMNTLGECVEKSQCLCQMSDSKTNLISGQTTFDRNKCEDCLCSNGCLNCRKSSNDCTQCVWSEWSPFGICSAKCNGTQTRYRSRTCNGDESELEHETRSCSTNETSYEKGCQRCSCNVATSEELCYDQCAITPDICSTLTNNPLITYEYVPPADGECCGTCNETKKQESCSVQELPSTIITHDNCISINPVAQQQCLGTCISGMKCRCCLPSNLTIIQVPMQCQQMENNSTVTFIQEIPYAKISSCSCQECTTYS